MYLRRLSDYNLKRLKRITRMCLEGMDMRFESTDQTVLDLLNKRVTVEQNIKAAEIADLFKKE